MAGASSVTAIADWLHDLDDIARARLGFGGGTLATTTVWRLLIRLDADLLGCSADCEHDQDLGHALGPANADCPVG
jgi:hypothetical protein